MPIVASGFVQMKAELSTICLDKGFTEGVGMQPVMLGDARLASDMANKLLDEGIYVIGFSYPVVPKDQARVRVQISAVHSPEDIDHAVKSFIKVARELGVLQ